MKGELVASNAARLARIESGEQVVVGVNAWTDGEPSPLVAGDDGGFLRIDPASEAEQVERLEAFRASRDRAAVDRALADLRTVAASGDNVMPASSISRLVVVCIHLSCGVWPLGVHSLCDASIVVVAPRPS